MKKKAPFEGYDQAQLSPTLPHPKLTSLGRSLSAADARTLS
jgi:hypothetical protein